MRRIALLLIAASLVKGPTASAQDLNERTQIPMGKRDRDSASRPPPPTLVAEPVALFIAGCDANSDGAEGGIRAGWDWELGDFVLGVVGEYGVSDARDAVSAFSTTPARYTYIRKVDTIGALRGRAGYIAGHERANLLYVTAGIARAELETSFNSSNTANTFTRSGDETVDGAQWGVGYERRFGEGLMGAGAWTVGIEYLRTTLDDEDGRVRVGRGTAPATNPFVLVNPSGTDIRRSDDEFKFDSLRVFATYRF